MLILTFAMVFILVVSIFAAVNLLYEEHSKPEFFVGVEMAYSNATFADVKDLVDKVKDYTNLVVIGSPEISKNQTLLNMTCDYIVDAGLNFVVLFTDTQMYSVDNSPKDWIPRATQKYGERFLAVYRYDEPGGGVLDHAHDSLIDETVVGRSANYSYASKLYVEYLYAHLSYYLVPSPSVLTADYGLFWFDYKSGYGTVLAELGSNHSREINVALCRGAGLARNRDWGTIITWKYNKTPYVESPDELYQDLVLSFRAGAKYAVVFDYPKVGRYGILNQTHLDKLSDFWSYVQSNPGDYGVDSAEVAYVLPADYGFGFRSADDHVWLWNADNLSQLASDDAKKLVSQYGSRFDIVYDDSETFGAVAARYGKLFFWNETIP